MSFKSLILTIISFLLIVKCSLAQSNFVHYSIESGLPSSEIYTIAQDSSGYIWFGTTKGVSRFDGYKFENFTAADGLPSNSVIRIFVDSWGRVWFSTYDGSLSYYQNGKIHPFKYNDTLLKIDKHYYLFNIFFNKDSTLWIMPSRGGIYKFLPDGTIKKFKIKPPTKDKAFFFKPLKNNKIIFTRIPGNKNDSLKLFRQNDQYFIVGFNSSFRADVIKAKNNFFIALDKQLFLVKHDTIKLLKHYSNSISGMIIDKNGDLWVSVMFEGIYIYDTIKFDLKNSLLHNKTPVKTFQDNEDGYWFGTIESGVFYTPSFQFNSFSEYNINAMDIKGEQLYFSTFDKFLFKCQIKNGNFKRLNAVPLLENMAIEDILIDKEQNIWLLGKKLIKIKNNKQKVIDKISGGFKLIEKPKGHILATSKNGFKEYLNDTLFYEFHSDKYIISNSIYKTDDGTIWLGSISGLYSFKNDSLIYWGKKFKQLSARINDIKQLNDNFLILATNGAGLLLFNIKNNNLIIIDKEHSEISSDFINVIYVEGNTIWLGTNKGLNKIFINLTKNKINFKVEKYNKADGLYSEEIKAITKKENYFYVGTSKGLVSFMPQKILKNKKTPILKIEKILINGREIIPETNITLKNNQNNITIFFKGISFRAQGNIIYKYKLVGFDKKWTKTTQLYVRYPNLPYGTYKFELYASADDQIWNKKPIIITFKIPKPFTHTIFFPLIIIIIIAAIIYLILWIRYRNINKQLEYKKRLILAEQKALRSQMNPHFIFNALNSIRRYILENDELKADYYLTSFATLMRKVLDNSKKDLITLEDEIQTLKLYIELEKMRFDKPFEFNLYIDNQLNTNEIYIPPMLIQPLLENSIWHGLAPKKDNLKLNLSFKIKKNILKIIIQDNGIGRDKAAEIAQKRKGHKSTGLRNIRDRIRYLSILTRSKLKLSIEDLYDEYQKPAGTRITIMIDYISLKKIYNIE